jgi:putative spermidine/putrescine transport system substrate-binding protein
MAGPSVTIVKTVSSAGSWQDAQEKALWEPAANALGISYSLDTSQGWADVGPQIDAGCVRWDILQIALADIPRASAAGVLEKLAPDVFDAADFVPGSCNEYFVANSIYSTVIAWNIDTFSANTPTRKFDFWDTDRFPGRRAMWAEPVGMIEAAALATGIPRDRIYSFLSTEAGRLAAIAKLKEIAPFVSVWWESGAEASELMHNSDVDLIFTWGGRVQGAIEAGARFAYTFCDGQIGTDGYSVVKDAPQRDAAMRFLKEVSKPEYQGELSNCFPTAPANLRAFGVKNYSPERLAAMASIPENIAVQYTADPEFWSMHGAWAYEAYEKVRQSSS